MAVFGLMVAAGLLFGGWYAMSKLGKTDAPPPGPTPPGAPPIGKAGNPTRKVPLADAVTRLATEIASFETGMRPFDVNNVFAWKGRAKRNNNPGNLRFNAQPGAYGKDEKGYAIFGAPMSGWNALLADVQAKIIGRTRTGLGLDSTLMDFISIYAPQTENPTAKYAQAVSARLGITPNTKFSDWIVT
jgi:hypothetical protein